MSEVSVLSQEYKTASDLSQRLNVALITVKKSHLRLPGWEAIDPHELNRQQRHLADAVSAIRFLLAPDRPRSPGNVEDVTSAVPGALVAQLRAARQGDLDYYLQDLEEVEAHLRKGVDTLTTCDLGRLDELGTAADLQTSSVFRRLMRT